MKRSTIVSLVAAAVLAFTGIAGAGQNAPEATVNNVPKAPVNALADSNGNAYNNNEAHIGAYKFNNSAEFNMETVHADPTGKVNSTTTIGFTGPGFVKDTQSDQGTAIAKSTGSMTANTNNNVFGNVDNPTNRNEYDVETEPGHLKSG